MKPRIHWLWNPWISVGIALGTIALSIIIWYLTGFIFIFFVLPIPILLLRWGKRNDPP
ncbi:MAG: hypothetical protein AB1665_06165 [Candidatus Thermoplasmatota archaeon]